MSARHTLFLTVALLLVGAVMADDIPPPVDAHEVRRLINELANEVFDTREQASARLLELGEAALPALREARTSPDLEVRRRAEQLLVDIPRQVADRAVQRLFAEVNRDGLDRFIERMARDKGFATTERWQMVLRLGSVTAKKASDFGGRWKGPNLDVARLSTEFGRDDLFPCNCRARITEPPAWKHASDSALVGAGSLQNLGYVSHSVLLVHGDLDEVRRLSESVVICCGSIKKITLVQDSVVLTTGPIGRIVLCDRSLIQAAAIQNVRHSRGNVYINVPQNPSEDSDGDSVVQTTHGPLDLLRFTKPEKPQGRK